jgi:hypothetical protein
MVGRDVLNLLECSFSGFDGIKCVAILVVLAQANFQYVTVLSGLHGVLIALRTTTDTQLI